MKHSKLLLAIFAGFMGAFIGSAQASDYYFFAETSGIIEPSETTYPFCEGDDCTYVNENGVDVSFDTTPDVFDIYLIGGSVSPYTFTTSGSAEISVSSSNHSVLSDSNVTINGNTVEVGSFLEKGETQIVLTAREDGQVVDQAFLNILVVDPSSAFITTWDVVAGDEVTMPTIASGYKYRGAISWDDGATYQAFDSSSDVDFTHTYVSSGGKTVIIDGTFEALNSKQDCEVINHSLVCNSKMATVENLGIVGWKSLNNAFMGTKITSFNSGVTDTSEVTDMMSMFSRAEQLTSADLSNFNTSSVTDMGFMFSNAIALISLDLSSFNTSNVTSMYGTFQATHSLVSLNISSFNTSNVTQMSQMFLDAKKLTNLNLSYFNTAKVTSMMNMFAGTSSMVSLNVDTWDTSSVTSMSYMFMQMNNLTSLDISHFRTPKVTSFYAMFAYSPNINALDLSSWEVSEELIATAGMFNGLKEITSLDLSSFDAPNLLNISQTFYGMSKLNSLNLSGLDLRGIDLSRDVLTNYTFSNVNSLHNIDYSTPVSADIYSRFLIVMSKINMYTPSNVAFNRGVNTCGTDTACDAANDYLRDTKGWTGMESD